MPCATDTMPAATAAAAPPDEPPGVCLRSHGLRVTPNGESVVPNTHSSGVRVRPTTTAPAARNRRTTSWSAGCGASEVAWLPMRVGSPVTATLSLIAIGTPASGRSARRSYASTASASISAASARTTWNAPIAGSRSAMHASASAVAARAVISPARTAAAIAVAVGSAILESSHDRNVPADWGRMSGMADPRAGHPATPADLVDIAHLVTAYYVEHPDVSRPEERVAFGTSGHRGSSLRCTFNEDHIVATSQAICEYRARSGIDGPLFLGADSHALSDPATASALEVFTANDVTVLIDSRDGYTPTPAISRAILVYNSSKPAHRADGVVVTPSHNPPSDGGFKYNPPDGGPAGTEITGWIQNRANELLGAGLKGVRRIPYARARAIAHGYDFLDSYVNALPRVIDVDAIRSAGIRIGADPLGGASVAYWGGDRRAARS